MLTYSLAIPDQSNTELVRFNYSLSLLQVLTWHFSFSLEDVPKSIINFRLFKAIYFVEKCSKI